MLDAAGHAAADAHFQVVEVNGLDGAIAQLALWGAANPLEQTVSDATGIARVRVPREFVDQLRIVAIWRGKTSAPVDVLSGDEPTALRLPE